MRKKRRNANRKLPSVLLGGKKTKSPTKIHMLIQGIVLHSKWYYATAQILTQTILFAFFLVSLFPFDSCHTICSKLFILLFFPVVQLFAFILLLCDSFSLSFRCRKKITWNKKFIKILLSVDKYLSNPVNVHSLFLWLTPFRGSEVHFSKNVFAWNIKFLI